MACHPQNIEVFTGKDNINPQGSCWKLAQSCGAIDILFFAMLL